MKKIFNWISKNRGAIVSVILALFSLSELIFHWVLGDKTIYWKGFDVIGIASFVVSIIVGVLTSGFSSTALQEALDKAKEVFKKDKEKGLTYQDRVAITKKIKELEKKCDELKKEYKPYIENVELGIGTDADHKAVNVYNARLGQIKSMIDTLKEKLK